MTKSGKKKARGSVEEDETNDTKRPNMADSNNATASPSSPSHDSSKPVTSLTELKGMLSNIQETLSKMKQENLSLREEVLHLKTTLKDEMLKWKKLDSTLEQISKENAELKKELQFTKQKLKTVTEEKDRIDFDLEELEQYTRKNSLEIHGIPQGAYTKTEDVVLKMGEVLDVLPACRRLLFPLLHAEKGRLRNAVANRVPASRWVPRILGTCSDRLTHSAHCLT